MTTLLLPAQSSAVLPSAKPIASNLNRLTGIRRAWRGSSSRFYSPALWMSDEELEMVAARVKGCSPAVIQCAVEAAEVGSALVEDANSDPKRETSPQTAKIEDQEIKKATRTLKIEKVGDFAAGKVKPRIRLHGYWLEAAGFKFGHYAEIRFPKLGEMVVHFREERAPLTLDNNDT